MTAFDPNTQRYIHLLDELGQAVIATDESGAILLWSSVAEALYGWRAHEVIGRNVLEVTPMDVSRAQGAEIMRTLMQGEIWSGEFQVQRHGGKPFLASVTDVPLISDAGTVAGVIGVSAPSRSPTKVKPLLKRLAKACRRIWPRQIGFELSLPSSASVAASEPHMIQLLSALFLLYSDALDRGVAIEVAVSNAEKSPFTDFGLGIGSSALYMRIDRRDEQLTYSVLRSFPFSAEPSKYTGMLVRMVGGMLIAGTTPGRISAMHLFLPLTSSHS